MGLAPFKPTPDYLARKQMRATQYDTNCHRVGRIVAFDKNTQLCNVEILELFPSVSEGGQKYAQINDLPLIIEGTDDSWITFGDIVGSECLIHFNDRDIDNWYETGEGYIPNSPRLHNMSDGFVTLRPRNKLKAIPNYSIDSLHIHRKNVDIYIKDDSVQISNGSCVFVMSGDTITVTGNLVVNGDITASGTVTGSTDVIADTISGKTHVHTGNLGTDTSAPH